MATIPLIINPFPVPVHVTIRIPTANHDDGTPKQSPTFALTQLPPEVLDQLCDQFRANVFAQAGQRDPKASRSNTELRTVIEDLMKR